MANTRSEVLEQSRRKGVAAGLATAGTVALAVVHAPVVLVAAAAVPAVLLGRRWWKHRAENGIRF